MNRNFRLIFLAALTAIFSNFLGVKSAEAMTLDELMALPMDQRVKVIAAKCGSDHRCDEIEIKDVSVKSVPATGNQAQVEKLEAAKAKLNVAIRKVKGGEISQAAEELVDKRDQIDRNIDVLSAPKVELADPTMFEVTAPLAPVVASAPASALAISSAPASAPPALAAYFPSTETCHKDLDCGKGACIEQVCFHGWAKSLDRAALKKGAQEIVESGLNATPGPSIDGGRLLCSLKSLQMSCNKLTCSKDEYPAVLGTSNSFPPDLQRLLDLIRAASSCAKDEGGECIESDWSYLANTNTVNFGHIQCLPRSTLPEKREVAEQRMVNATIAAMPPAPPSVGHGSQQSADDSDLSVTVGANVGYHSGFRDTFYNNGFGSLLVEPTWFSGDLVLRFPMSGGYGGRDQFSTLYHLMGGFIVGYRINDSVDIGGGALASGLYGYTPIDGVGSYLEQYQVDGTISASFLLGGVLELSPFVGIGYVATQVFPDHNISFGGGLRFGIPIGRD